jgi:hypothetical protein
MGADLARLAMLRGLSASTRGYRLKDFPREEKVRICHVTCSPAKPYLQSETDVIHSEFAAPKSGHDSDQISDRGSIQFLLNSGTASFIECFRFPSTSERKHIFDFKGTANELNSFSDLDLFGNGFENSGGFPDTFEDEPIDWSLFEDQNLLRFLSSPFSDAQMQLQDLSVPMFTDPTFGISNPDSDMSVSVPEVWESASVQSAAVVRAMLDTASLLHISAQELAEVSDYVNFLFTPTKIEKLINQYFEFWGPHCPIIYQPSFNVETAPIPLLISMTLMGSMYSQIDSEVSTAKRLFDLAEIFIFSLEDLSAEFEIRQMLSASRPTSLPQSIMPSLLAFEHLQAAYLMVCVQFWAGNTVSKKRAVDTRFGVVVKVTLYLKVDKEQY